jgi:hypothetical protein
MYLKKSLLRLLGEVPPHESARLHEVGVQLALHLLLHPPPRDKKKLSEEKQRKCLRERSTVPAPECGEYGTRHKC